MIFVKDSLSDVNKTQVNESGTKEDLELSKFLNQIQDVFIDDIPGELPPKRGDDDHAIELIPGSSPPNKPPYRVSQAQQEEIMRQVNELVEKGMVRPSSSPFCSPVFLVHKKDGTYRMCVDYRALNTITIKNRFPVPRIEDLFDKLQGSTYFSRIDLKSGYHQIRIVNEDILKTAFRTTFGLYEYLVMPFGLTNAPATFNRIMERIFRPHRNFTGVFFDDVIIYSKSMEEHKKHLQVILSLNRASVWIPQSWRMPRQKYARQWAKGPYEVDELSTHEKSHITDDVLAQIPAHIFIAKFKDAEGESIKTTIMPRDIWTLHRKPKVVDAIRAIPLEKYFRLPPWGTYYMRAHELMSLIQYDGKALLTDKDGSKNQVLITTDMVNEALHFYPGTYNLLAKTKSIDNEKAFLKAKGNKYKYSDMIYSKLELSLRLISQHFRVQKPPRYIEPLLHIAIVMALSVAKKRQIICNFEKFILESLIETNLKNSSKNKLYMSAGPMLTRIACQALDMIEDLPAVGSQASLVHHARFVAKAVKTTTTATSSRSTRSSKKSSSDNEKTNTDKEQASEGSNKEEGSQKGVEAKGPLEHEPNYEEDTSTPLDRKSKKPRSAEQILLDEAMARVEAGKKELADAREAKVAKLTKPMTMDEARKARMERRKLEAEQKAQEEAVATQSA
ncbi:hypothetical protein L7F22_004247 [Adiantum nelumboides]|nr:hypothetical protein [Adiantum nelumboides]